MTDSTTPPPPPPSDPTGGSSGGTNPNLMAALAHGLVITGFLGPLIVWLIGKDQSPFVDEEGKKALNFGILISIGYVVSIIPLIGWLVWIAAIILALVFGIQGAVAANKGQAYTYPFTLPIVK